MYNLKQNHINGISCIYSKFLYILKCLALKRIIYQGEEISYIYPNEVSIEPLQLMLDRQETEKIYGNRVFILN